MRELAEMAFTNFIKKNGASPQQVFVYRDGVSISQLELVSSEELKAIQQAARNVCKDFANPAIQFMIIQKRVNARFFQDIRNNSVQSAQPPIIIDQGPVSKNKWDFYLIACGAPRDKVANPVRVIVIFLIIIKS